MPVARQAGGVTLGHSIRPPPPSIDNMPSPTPQITLKLGKNIEHGSYNGSPENQGTAAS